MIDNPIDIHSVSEAIRDAVAPVFLLTGVGSILGVLIGRLARAIDRARLIYEMPQEKKLNHRVELVSIIKRTKWLRRAIWLATLGALSVCVSIASLFISVETGIKIPHVVMLSFILSMVSIILALCCFMREIILASSEVIVPFKRENNQQKFSQR